MPRFNDGEYMNLVWDGAPDAYYIRGHFSHDEGIAILEDAGVIGFDDDKPIGKAIHAYGRWSTEANHGLDCSHILREYSGPGRGRFKVTVFNLGIFAVPRKEPLCTPET